MDIRRGRTLEGEESSLLYDAICRPRQKLMDTTLLNQGYGAPTDAKIWSM